MLEHDPAATPMTTGAAYNIWTAQEDFQLSLLEHILTGSSVPGVDRVDAALEADIACGLDGRDLVATCFGGDFDISFAESTMFVMIGVGALATPTHDATTNEQPNMEYTEITSALPTPILARGGRCIAQGRTMEDLVCAIEAIEDGYLLRRRSHPDVTAPLATAPSCRRRSRGWWRCSPSPTTRQPPRPAVASIRARGTGRHRRTTGDTRRRT